MTKAICGFLYMVALLVMLVCSIIAVISLPNFNTEATTFAIATAGIVLAGILWILVEISGQLIDLAQPKEAKDVNATAASASESR